MDRNINVLDSNEEDNVEEGFEQERNENEEDNEKEKKAIIEELENLYSKAINIKDKEELIRHFKQIIEKETSNLTTKNFAFKVYSYLSLKSFDEENIEDFTKYFAEVQHLLPDENYQIEQKLVSDYIKSIIKKLEKFPIKKIKTKEIFLNKIISMVKDKETKAFFQDLQEYLDENRPHYTINNPNDDSPNNSPLVSLNIFYPKIPVLNIKSLIIEDSQICIRNFKEINNFILTSLSNGKFIYYYDDSEDGKFIYISDKSFFNNEITIETKYICYEIKELYNDDIMICSKKKSKIIRVNYDTKTYEIIQSFKLPNYENFNYCVELSKDFISFGKDDEGYSIWKKINDNYEFIHGVFIENEKRKIFPIDNMNYLTYSYIEETFDNKIELKFYDLSSFNFFGRINFKVTNHTYYRYSSLINDKFFELNYIQKYFLLIGYYNSIWILNLNTLQILHHLELEEIREIRILKDSSFLIFYNTCHISNNKYKYENFYFDGDNLMKKWEDKTSAHLIEVLDNFDFVFVDKNNLNPHVKISHMKYSTVLYDGDNDDNNNY